MGITYSSQVGATYTSFVMNETLGDQTQQSGNNQVVVSDDIVTLENGQIGDGTNGIGGSYIGRRVTIRLGDADEESEICTAETAGTGNTYILTMKNDWVSVPVATSDTIHVSYELADQVDGLGSGLDLNTRTGFFEATNYIVIGNATDPAGVYFAPGQMLELSDENGGNSFNVKNNGYVYFDTVLLTTYNPTAGESELVFDSGSTGYFFNTLLLSQRESMGVECLDGSSITFEICNLTKNLRELLLYGATIIDCYATGEGDTTDFIRVDAGTTCDGLVIASADSLDTAINTTTETIELAGVVDNGITDIITIRENKTWNMIDPVWGATLYSDFNDGVVVGTAAINDQRSVTPKIQTAAGIALQDAMVIVYEGSTDNLVIESPTDVNGQVDTAFDYKAHSWSAAVGSTVTYSGHALRIDKWLYTPFAAAQVSTDPVSGTYTLIPDSNIVQTTQATALTAGSGITWNEDTNPSDIFDFTLGSGTVAVGMILTFSPSGAVGTVTKSMSGDSVAGEIHLKDRNSTAIANGDTFSRTGGTAGTFSGTYTNDSKQAFSIWVDANSKSYQASHDYLAALTSETTLSATAELIHEWGKGVQTRVLYVSGGVFSTERSDGKGVIFVNGAAGTVGHFTDDSGGIWIPPETVTIEFTGLPENCEARLKQGSFTIDHVQNVTGGVYSYQYVFAEIEPIKYSFVMPGYNTVYGGAELKSTDQSIALDFEPDPSYIT